MLNAHRMVYIFALMLFCRAPFSLAPNFVRGQSSQFWFVSSALSYNDMRFSRNIHYHWTRRSKCNELLSLGWQRQNGQLCVHCVSVTGQTQLPNGPLNRVDQTCVNTNKQSRGERASAVRDSLPPTVSTSPCTIGKWKPIEKYYYVQSYNRWTVGRVNHHSLLLYYLLSYYRKMIYPHLDLDLHSNAVATA